MSCDGSRYGTAKQYSQMFCGEWPLEAEVQARIEQALDMTAFKIDMALHSVDACDCTLSTAGTNALAYLNCLLAVVHYRCPCSALEQGDDMRSLWAEEAQLMMDALLDGSLEVCQGETGSQFVYFDWAEHALTPWNEAQIIINTELRNS